MVSMSFIKMFILEKPLVPQFNKNSLKHILYSDKAIYKSYHFKKYNVLWPCYLTRYIHQDKLGWWNWVCGVFVLFTDTIQSKQKIKAVLSLYLNTSQQWHLNLTQHEKMILLYLKSTMICVHYSWDKRWQVWQTSSST